MDGKVCKNEKKCSFLEKNHPEVVPLFRKKYQGTPPSLIFKHLYLPC